MASILVDDRQDGGVVAVTTRDTVVLRLPENPTTGVRWSFDQLHDSVQLVGDDYEAQPGDGIGAASIRVLTLRLSAPGDFPVRLQRWQEWEGAGSIDATFGITLKVDPAAES